MNPAVQLLLVHLQKAQARNAVLKVQVDSLRSTLKRCRESRDEWKRRALMYRKRSDNDRNRLRDARASRDLWRHRALREATPTTSPERSIGTPTSKRSPADSGLGSRI